MQLINKILEKRFAQVGTQDGKGKDAIVIAKYFNPTGAGNWYATEYEPINKIFFGFVSIFGDWNDEWGSFSLGELESFKGKMGLGIERDLYCGEKTIGEWGILNK